MKKNELIISILNILLFCTLNIYATQDSLILYTKPGCSNCLATKQILQQSGIFYTEKSLDNTENATEMLRKIAASGYHGEIYLPVIYLNTELYHPAYKTGKVLISLGLQDVVDSLKYKFRNGLLNLRRVEQIPLSDNSESSSGSSDCELKTTPIYLICSVYDTEEKAKNEMNKLIKSGYSFAGYIFYQKQFRVFSKFFYDRSLTESELAEIKKTYPQAYIFEMNR